MPIPTSRTVIVAALAVALALEARAFAADAAAGAPAKTAGKPAADKKPADKKPAPAKKTAVKSKAPKAAAPAVEPVSGPHVRDFQTFCDTWMQKLRDRNTYNAANVKWETRDGRVAGEHVTYVTESTCIAREEPGKDPIGKITYREMRYRREGATQTEALAAPGTIVEQSDVTEIFRFAKGRWQY